MSDFQGRHYAGTLLSKAQTVLPSLTPHHFRQLSAYLEELKRLTSDGVLLGFSLVYVSRWNSFATVRTGVFANLSNKMAKITGKFENVDEAKNRGVTGCITDQIAQPHSAL